MLDEAITSYPSFHKFYLMAAQACESENKGTDKRLGDMKAARDFYQRGLKKCPKCAALWIGAAALEEKAFGATRARSVLELARSRNKGTPSLWLAAMRLERRHGHQKLAENLQAKALQECESSGELWADCISTAPRPARKGKSLEALKRCDNDARVIVAVANLFVSERNHNKARKWSRAPCSRTGLRRRLGARVSSRSRTAPTRRARIGRSVRRARSRRMGNLDVRSRRTEERWPDVAQKLRLCAEKLRAEDEEALA